MWESRRDFQEEWEGWDNSPLRELLHNRAYARRNNQLTHYEHWKGNQKTGLDLNIMKKGQPAWDMRCQNHWLLTIVVCALEVREV
jgi:hypothetical protein